MHLVILLLCEYGAFAQNANLVITLTHDLKQSRWREELSSAQEYTEVWLFGYVYSFFMTQCQ